MLNSIEINNVEVGDVILYNDQYHVAIYTETDFSIDDYDTGLTRVYTVKEDDFIRSDLYNKNKAQGSILISVITDINNDYRLPYRYKMIDKGKYKDDRNSPSSSNVEYRWDFEDLEEGDDLDSNDPDNADFGDLDPWIYPVTDLIDRTDVDFGMIEEDIDYDDGSFNFGDLDYELYHTEPKADGDYDFADEDEGRISTSVVHDEDNYDFTSTDDEPDNGDSVIYNFGDIDDKDESAEGDYNFKELSDDGTEYDDSDNNVVQAESNYNFFDLDDDDTETDITEINRDNYDDFNNILDDREVIDEEDLDFSYDEENTENDEEEE